VKTSELKGAALDWAVALASGATDLHYDTIASWWFKLGGKDRTLSKGWADSQRFNPSTKWACGGPIIEREKINLRFHQHYIGAFIFVHGQPKHLETGGTALIAAMRCYVASKRGDEVHIPEELG
jgi:hypothetical protein